MTFDLAGYLKRVGYAGAQQPSLDTLHALVADHNRSIPFENLDPLLGIPVADLGPEALTDKLVYRGRGGYCYEHNGLMAYALEELGFGVERWAGRVLWMQPDDTLHAQTHNALAVTVPESDGRWLVDVGFGGQTLSSPIRLQTDVVQQTRHEPYRLRDHPEGYLLEAQIQQEWRPLYSLSTRDQPRIDLEVGSWYVSTFPGSHFTSGLTAALVTDDARYNLRGRNLAIHRDGQTERIRFDSAAEVLDALTDRFGIDLDGLAGHDIESRLDEVLDN